MKRETLVSLTSGRPGGKCLSGHGTTFMLFCLIIGLVLGTASSIGCGHQMLSQRIIGGTNSSLGRWPWMCSLVYENRHICGASLISRNYVITAAHCVMNVDQAQLYVMMGMVDLVNPGSTRAVYTVTSVLINPIFQGHGSSGDAALLRLHMEVIFNNYIQPVCLPATNQIFPQGQLCTLAGWGRTVDSASEPPPTILQEVMLPVINSTTCDQIFSAKYKKTYNHEVRTDMICAGYANQRKDGCQGDSGGPLMCQVNGNWYLAGLMSWGVGCATPGVPGVYTHTANFTTWIIANTDLAFTNTRITSNTTGTTSPLAGTNDTITGTNTTAETLTTAKPNNVTQGLTSAPESATAGGRSPRASMTGLVVVALLLAKIIKTW